MKYMINRAFGLRGVLTLLALMLAFAASAQNKITGKVVDENDQPAIGANVVVKGTTQGVSTDLKGMFAIPVKTGDVLVFSYLGYKSQEVKIAAQTRLDIKLVPEANIMDEVVVVGYGAVKRGDLTGSVASVSSKDVEGFKTGSVMEALGGQIAGVQITATDGTPGAGFDIKALVAGATDMEKATGVNVPFGENIAAQYAAVRNALYNEGGKKIEIMVNYQPKLHFIAEWWKQLYGESEGKDGKGIFPASCDFTTDLHSMGQWIQDGERSIYETVISVETPNRELDFPHDDENLDGLNFLAGKRVDEVNKMAELGTRLAHVDGGVPNIRISVPVLNEYYIGQLIYFFEIGCGISGNILGVNPFNQPGVEAYKKNMFALLNKPGYEAESKAIQERLQNEK